MEFPCHAPECWQQSCHDAPPSLTADRWAQDLAGVDLIPSLPPGAQTADQRVGTLDGLATYRREQRVQVGVAAGCVELRRAASVVLTNIVVGIVT